MKNKYRSATHKKAMWQVSIITAALCLLLSINVFATPNSVKVRTVWDNTNLYLAFEITDSQVENPTGNPWEQDAIELYLDAGHTMSTTIDADDYQWIITAANVATPYYTAVGKTIQKAVTVTGSGYNVEMAIPWTQISTTPVVGKILGALFVNDDMDAGSTTTFDWKNIASGGYARPNLWGDITLSNTEACSAGGGLLTGSVTSASTAVNLTTEGTADWAHYYSTFDHKSSGGSKISNYTVVGSGTVGTYDHDPRPMSWTDGAPTASSTNNINGLYVYGIGNGFSITAPADATSRTLKVYVGGSTTSCTLIATLSDGSAAAYTNTTTLVSGEYNDNYTITYKAASAGQTLTVVWKIASGGSCATFHGAALSGGSAPVAGISIAQTTGSNPTCAGASVTFTATPTNGGTAPAYQWKVSGTNAGTNSPTFTTTTLTNGQIVTCVMTSNLGGVTGNPATSNGITMTVNAVVVPAVAIAITTGTNPICAGTSVTFTTTPTNGGTTPSYQWKVGGVNAGTNNPTFATSALTNGQVVTCVLTSNATCASPTTATSTGITMTVNPVVVPTVAIAITTGTNPTCAGTSVTFTATPTNGGTTPAYQWKVSGVNAGTNIPIFATSTLTNGQIVTCVLTSNATCASPATATSTGITMTVNTCGSGSLSGSVTSASTAVNLTTEGTSDWTHYYSTFDHKSTGGSQISNYTVVGSGTVGTYDHDPRPMSWTNGTPTASSTNNINGLYVYGIGNGFSITAPADTTLRTLKVYVGGSTTSCTLIATLSDGSAAAYTNTTTLVSGEYDDNYTLTYKAASAGQTLTVVWKIASGGSCATFHGAALSGGSVAGVLTGTVNNNTTAVNLTNVGTADWAHYYTTFDHKSSGGSQISNYTMVAGTATAYPDDVRPMSWTDGTPTASSTNNTTGIYTTGTGSGFSITAPADATNSRTLNIYAGGYLTSGTLTATLSDGSASAYTNTTTLATGAYSANYTITYNAASAGKTLTVTWKVASGTGSVSLSGAALTATLKSATIATGLGTMEDAEKLTVYPNPANQFLTIELSGIEGNQQIQIFNSVGSLVKMVEIAGSTQLDISGLSNGLYFVHLKNHSLKNQKFIKQ